MVVSGTATSSSTLPAAVFVGTAAAGAAGGAAGAAAGGAVMGSWSNAWAVPATFPGG